MYSGNKGEWSEVYVIFKLLFEGKLYAGDRHLNVLPNQYYNVIDIFRTDGENGEVQMSINGENIEVFFDNQEHNIDRALFEEASNRLFEYIPNQTGSFQHSLSEEYLTDLGLTRVQANSRDKKDIELSIQDTASSIISRLGFSIKSQLGSPSTLINASGSTNFVYRLEGITDDVINEIEHEESVSDLVEEIYNRGGRLEYQHNQNNTFSNNLILVDSALPQILAECLVEYYRGNQSKLSEIVPIIHDRNPIDFDITQNHQYYEYKIKKYLVESALGLMPARIWDGVHDSGGGVIVVKRSGDIISYHAINRNLFEDYLYYQTKFETPSTTRHNFGSISYSNGYHKLKLNLQIRFIS